MNWLKSQEEHDAVLVAATKEFVKVTIYSVRESVLARRDRVSEDDAE